MSRKLPLWLAGILVLSACSPDPESTLSGGAAGGSTSSSSTSGTAASGGTGGAGATGGASTGSGGAPDPNCAVPPGASDLIHEGIPAAGLVCTRFPFPLASPRDVLQTKDGHLFATEFGAGHIVELTESGFVTVASNLVSPIGLREAADGSLLVSEEGLHSLAKVDRATGVRTLIATVPHNVTYLALGPDGAAYLSSFAELADSKKGVVYRVDLGTGVAAPFATGLNVPEGLFLDATGALFVTEWLLPSTVYHYPSNGGDIAAATQLADGFDHAYGLLSDGAGGIFVGDHAGRVVRIASDGTQTDIVTGIGRPGGLWRAASGDLWIAEFVDFGQTGYLIRISGF